MRSGSSSGLFWQRLLELGARSRIWRELGFALLALPLGVLGFAVVASVVWLMVVGFAQVIFVALGGETQLGSWTVDTVAEALVFMPVSLTFLLVGPRVLLGWGAVVGRVVTGMLGRIESRELKRGVVDVLAQTGAVDGFGVLDNLRVRLGRGPFLTPVHVEAALLALESNGTICADHSGHRTSYRVA